MKMLWAVLSIFLILATLACGNGQPNCVATSHGIHIVPGATIVDHSAVPPGNQVTFHAVSDVSFPPGCPIAVTAPLVSADWTVSDKVDVSIANSSGAGVATCLAATKTPAVVTATAPVSNDPAMTATATASLTCQ